MKSMKSWMLSAALVVGGLGLATVPAHAARWGVYVGVGAPAAYMPPCPGPGYAWINGYYADGGWVPGYWNYAGDGDGDGYGYGGYYRGGDRYWHGDDDHGWDRGGRGWGHEDHWDHGGREGWRGGRGR